MRINQDASSIWTSYVVSRQEFVAGTPKVSDIIFNTLKVIHCCNLGGSMVPGCKRILRGDII